MKLVAKVKLRPAPEQAKALRETLEACNEACNFLAGKAWDTRQFRQYDLHKIAYRETRERFGLTAQAAVRCIAKVADAYKLDRNVKRSFRRHGAQPYDARIFRFVGDDVVSIWTVMGRQKIACVTSLDQRRLLAFRKGEVDLMLVRGEWYVGCVCDIDEPDVIDAKDVLGVDLGIVNIATDSDGKAYAGESIEKTRVHLSRRRAGLQRRATKAAKRRLRILSGQQRRFQTHTNHCISKALVEEAQRSGRGIGLEELTHIRNRIKARRSQRARLSNWAFSQLRQFVTYKARRLGIPVLFVDPRYTSKGCACCGCIDDQNRPNQATFSCVSCGHAEPADLNAARNIRLRARAALVTSPLSSQAAKAA